MSKIDRRINPTAPATAKNRERIAQALSNFPLLGANWPACRSHRSEKKARSRNTTVITLPVMKSGFNPCAPTSEMYLLSCVFVLVGVFKGGGEG